MDTRRLSRSPAAMRPLPRIRSASDAIIPAKPEPSSPGEGCPACLPLLSPSSAAATSSPASRSGPGEACTLHVPGGQQPQPHTHAPPPPIQLVTTRQHVPRAPPRSARDHVVRGARASAPEVWMGRSLPCTGALGSA